MASARPRPAIGVLIDALYNEYGSALVAAFEAASLQRNVDLICFAGGTLNSRKGNESERNRCYELVSSTSLDGLIVLAMSDSPKDHADLIAGFGQLPVCSVGMEIGDAPLVCVDNAAGMSAGIDHLITEHDKRRLAFLKGPEANQEAQQRYLAYERTLARHGIAFDPELVAASGFSSEAGRRGMRALLERHVSFDAVVAADDSAALGALSFLTERGISVPHDVALIGFDDCEDARAASPPLSSVRQPYWDLAARALDILIAELQGHRVPRRVELESEFVRRRSCGCLSEGARPSLPPTSNQDGVPFERAFARRRADLRSILFTAARSGRIEGVPGWGERFLDELQSVIEGASDTELLNDLDGLLAMSIDNDGELSAWQTAASNLRHKILPCVTQQPDLWLRFEDVWNRVRVMICDAIERKQRTLRAQAEYSAGLLTHTRESLITTFDVASMPRALAERLPALGIASCYISLYASNEREHPPPISRLVVAYENGRLLPIPKEATLFPTRELVPEYFRSERRRSVVVQPLFFEHHQLGFGIFELGPKRHIVYELLRELISAALKGADLVKQVADEAAQREKAEKDRLRQELAIAERIQTSILPRNLAVEGLEIAATMLPASEVGGDYYDIFPTEGGAWLGIGDVAGHGLRPGLVMVMLQSVIAALGRSNALGSPSALLNVVNSVIYDNVRGRLQQDEHATLSLIRYERSGKLIFAGAHEDIIICSKRTGKTRLVPTPGTWVGATRDISAVTVDSECQLEDGDIFVLYTDGILEAANEQGEHFGIERLCAEIEHIQRAPVAAIRDHVMDVVKRFLTKQEDDIALVVARYRL
jgi:DNA-binding LacI/PurR family transcriptional regulator/serine phosphatase RsbU (regulator of sigma subunit)